jgi:hypothetical protein
LPHPEQAWGLVKFQEVRASILLAYCHQYTRQFQQTQNFLGKNGFCKGSEIEDRLGMPSIDI